MSVVTLGGGYANVSQKVFGRLSLPHVSVDAFIKELPTVCQPTFEHRSKTRGNQS